MPLGMEMNCPHQMSRFNVTRKGAARALRAYIAASPQIHCNPSSCLSNVHENDHNITISILTCAEP